MTQMKTTTFDSSCRIKRQPKIPTKTFLFIVKQQVGSLVYGKDHMVMRPKKTFRLCLRNERWRIFAWIHVWSINSWPVYIENYGIIEKLSRTIKRAIAKYRERRFETGLFYFVPDKKHLTFTVSSYLYGDGEFLKDLWRKKRLERSMREKNQELHECSTRVFESYVSEYRKISSIAVRTLRLCGMGYVFYLMLVISLALAIVYL
ncbi:unnamed protein product [Triticum turgidum subsp. durum]|uniref:Uncharacterized protein n=1 Tax=Triticum turgidum subsp. durum TaxID=4567 RepID=A0A9R1PT35_TRITD|nr:unnamed protein product [Triticum turgidum subsp. durum]